MLPNSGLWSVKKNLAQKQFGAFAFKIGVELFRRSRFDNKLIIHEHQPVRHCAGKPHYLYYIGRLETLGWRRRIGIEPKLQTHYLLTTPHKPVIGRDYDDVKCKNEVKLN